MKELRENTVLFNDGSSEPVDVVFYCTGKLQLILHVKRYPNVFNNLLIVGYNYSFPFLDKKCGVQVDSNMVTPLWKHLVSIENPTLVFIGIPFYVCAFSMFDLQVRLKETSFCNKTVP